MNNVSDFLQIEYPAFCKVECTKQRLYRVEALESEARTNTLKLKKVRKQRCL